MYNIYNHGNKVTNNSYTCTYVYLPALTGALCSCVTSHYSRYSRLSNVNCGTSKVVVRMVTPWLWIMTAHVSLVIKIVQTYCNLGPTRRKFISSYIANLTAWTDVSPFLYCHPYLTSKPLPNLWTCSQLTSRPGI